MIIGLHWEEDFLFSWEDMENGEDSQNGVGTKGF